jgi:hypothetical protein
MGWTPHSEDRLRRTTRPRNDHGGYSEGSGTRPTFRPHTQAIKANIALSIRPNTDTPNKAP